MNLHSDKKSILDMKSSELTSASLHALNNLLQGIMGLSELLEANPDIPKEAKMDAHVILELAADASELVKRIKYTNRIPNAQPETSIIDVVADVEVQHSIRSNVNILIAEDDPLVLKVVAGMLNALGYSTTLTCDGQEALERYRENHENITLILSDLDMPRMGGLKLAAAILKDYPNALIIVMTGYLYQELEIKPDEFGLAAWLEKPLKAATLESTIEGLIGS